MELMELTEMLPRAVTAPMEKAMLRLNFAVTLLVSLSE